MVRPLRAKIAIAIPTIEPCVRSLNWVHAYTQIHIPLGASLARIPVLNLPIAEARNEICRQALAYNAEYLLMLGDDVLPPPNVLLQMLTKIGRVYPTENGREERCSLVTGVYWTKTYPSEPYLFRAGSRGPFMDWTAGEFFPIDYAGCDCLLIETEILRHIPPPWFSTDWVFEPGDVVTGGGEKTEDFYFYQKARQHGFRLWADTTLQCEHEDRETGITYGLREEMRQAGKEPRITESGRLMADIAAGFWSPTVDPGTKIVRFDGRRETKPDVVCDVRDISPAWHGKFDTVHASHILEHFPRPEVRDVVCHWLKLLKPGGKIIIAVPNLERAMTRILDAINHPHEGRSDSYDWAQLFGDQGDVHSFVPHASIHRSGFVAPTLQNLLRSIPELYDVQVIETDDGVNLRGTATYRGPTPPPALSAMLTPEQIAEIDGEIQPAPMTTNGAIHEQTPVEAPS